MSGPWSDLQRPPLSERALRAALTREGEWWTDVRVVTQTTSTNDDQVAAARAGVPEGSVLVAESQSAGRGRLDRSWVSPPRAGLTFSALFRPTGVPVARWAWLPLLTGVSLCAAVSEVAELDTALKWPNDLVVNGRKLAGVLAVVAAGAAVVGVGLNVTTRSEELPRADATSLTLEQAGCMDRDTILRAVLRRLAVDYQVWQSAAGDPAASGLHAAYLAACDTVDRSVSVALPSGEMLAGTATGVDVDGRLVVATGAGERTVAAGDVLHVR
ncbi:MAG TPA: biotin--[acetyl-CoA-carboxylase] ligase [Mycobacteriales bacterium]